ncbi:MAG: hypothetical protein H5T63_01410 [Chloroflexi bacterium]|nr:hypothetical protein [Chloroflexota bacterium]
MALAGEPTVIQDLCLLRAFRDQVLSCSPVGEHWIALYEQHRTEIAWILATNAQLRNKTRIALKQWLPLIQALTFPDAVKKAILTSEHLDSAEAIIGALSTMASPQLRADLEAGLQFLDQGQKFTGTDIREVWRKLTSEP